MSYNKKNILLVEDCQSHAEKTHQLLQEIKDMYSMEYKVFPYLIQNGNTRDQQFDAIKKCILNEINEKKFDIIMMDMILGGDSAETPLGLQVIKDLIKEIQDKKIKIFVYTELSSDYLDSIKNYNKSIENYLKIIIKPDLKVLENRVDCAGDKRKNILEENGCKCIATRCTYKEKFLCDMKGSFFELEDMKNE